VSNAKSKVVRFIPEGDGAEPITLTLDGPIVQRAGLKPDVWTARVPYTEFDKLGDDPGRQGVLAMWYTYDADGGPPDVVIAGVSIVDVEAGATGRVPDGVFRITEYRLHLSDFRDRFIEPRGGRLRLGLINPTPKEAANDDDDADEKSGAAPDDARTMTLSEMIVACMKAMGFGDTIAPLGVDDVPAPKDVRWFGNHAPTELGKLLSLCDCTFCPKLDGTGKVERLGIGIPPTFPAGDALPSLDVPAVDRRGKSVIFTSHPTRITVTETLEAPDPDKWYFVMQDDDQIWKEVDQCKVVGTKGLLYHVQNHFKEIPDKSRQRVQRQAYRYLRLSWDRQPPGLSPVFAAVMEKQAQQSPIVVKGKVAVQGFDKTWSNAAEPVEVPAQYVQNWGNILQVGRALLQVSGPTTDPESAAKVPAAGDLTVRMTYEKAHKDDKGKWMPDYFHVGFRRGAGGVEKLSDDEVENALDGGSRDALVITRPQMRLQIIDGEEQNRSELEDECEALADRYLAESNRPTILRAARGFQRAECNGAVSEVKWDQGNLLTIVTIANWWAPTGAISDASLLRKLEEGEAYPNQKKVSATRDALGESGSPRGHYPVNPIDAPTSPGENAGLAKVWLPNPLHGGFYEANLLTGTADNAGTDAVNPTAAPLSMPEGQAVAQHSDFTPILYNIMEDGHATSYLRDGQYVPILRTAFDDKRKRAILATCMPSFEHLFWVDLVQDGGGDAVWSGNTFVSPVTYTYTAKVVFSTTQKLGTKLSPIIRQSYMAITTPATMGLGCFLGAQFQLIFTDEKHSESACT
jgi:hypothetical protein